MEWLQGSRLWVFAAAFCLLLSPAGCSLLIASRPVAYITINEPGHKQRLVQVPLDAPTRNRLAVEIGERYTIQLNPRWLLYREQARPEKELFDNRRGTADLPQPLVTAKYNF